MSDLEVKNIVDAEEVLGDDIGYYIWEALGPDGLHGKENGEGLERFVAEKILFLLKTKNHEGLGMLIEELILDYVLDASQKMHDHKEGMRQFFNDVDSIAHDRMVDDKVKDFKVSQAETNA